ncbi:MAG TPA: rhamnulokinase family protein [Nocardioidaceae bacterium]|nr:rhamnulokinase family protein [Nocardioidaceae bacterium]
MSGSVAAVDLGASSGRVVLGRVLAGGSANRLEISTVHRFANRPVATIDGLHWDVLGLYRDLLDGIGLAAREEPSLRGVAVDSWAVDYALLRGSRMLGSPFHYRDTRTESGVPAVHAAVSPGELYAATGLQHLPFNTLYQLAAEDLLSQADALLLVPDLVGYWLSGARVTEATNASTTGLVNVTSGDWDEELIGRLGLPRRVFQPIVEPGTSLGGLRAPLAAELGVPPLEVTTVGSHDTASAVVGVPMLTDDAAYISCGTWGLVGLELEAPVLSEQSRAENFTNERGVDGRIRYLRNVMGLWLLSESVRWWERDGDRVDLTALLEQAAAVRGPVPLFAVDDPRFLAPGDVPVRIASWFAERGLAAPQSRAEMARCVLESLAQAFADTVETAERLAGKPVGVIHLVGGGAQNRLLCRLTANRSGRPVLAGPVEATACGNVLVQARTHGLLAGDLETLRAVVAESYPPVRYAPELSGGVAPMAHPHPDKSVRG